MLQVGFVVGTDGILPFLQQCLLEPWFVLGTTVVCFSAVQLMFEIRTLEQRHTIAVKSSSLHVHASSHKVIVAVRSPTKSGCTSIMAIAG